MSVREMHNDLMENYESLKREIRRRDINQYERWKAGGYLIDENIVSMYPNLSEVVESVFPDDEEED